MRAGDIPELNDDEGLLALYHTDETGKDITPNDI